MFDGVFLDDIYAVRLRLDIKNDRLNGKRVFLKLCGIMKFIRYIVPLKGEKNGNYKNDRFNKTVSGRDRS